MARILKPEGKLLLTVPNDESIKYRVEGIPKVQLHRFDCKSIPALLAGSFKDLRLQLQGIWVPIPLVSLHAPDVYPAQ